MNKQLTVKDIVGHEIGDEIWFIAKAGEPIRLDIEYADHVTNGTNTTYRFIPIPVKGRIISLYVTRRAKSHTGTRLINTGGFRVFENDLILPDVDYNPETDIISFEVETEFSPGTTEKHWNDGLGLWGMQLDVSIDNNIIKSMMQKLLYPSYFVSGLISVESKYAASSPEEAEEKFIDGNIEYNLCRKKIKQAISLL